MFFILTDDCNMHILLMKKKNKTKPYHWHWHYHYIIDATVSCSSEAI